MRPAGAALALLMAANLNGANLGERIRAILETSPARRAFWGVQVYDLDSGTTLFDKNSKQLFTPASTAKLFSTAVALVRLGPDHRFHTRVLANASPDSTGVVSGDIVLEGGGDPNLPARSAPYQTGGPPRANLLQPVEQLAAQLWERGLREVRGAVVGDDTWYPWEPYAEGWAADDAVWEYGAAVSALTLHDNAFSLLVTPGRTPGGAAAITLEPPLEFYHIDNRVRSVPGREGKLLVTRLPGSTLLQVWGTVPAGGRPQRQWLAIHDPAWYAAFALRDALIRRGVRIRGPASARHADLNQLTNALPASVPATPEQVELARLDSAPLLEDLRIVNKLSQNLHAELLLRAVGRQRTNVGSRQAGLAELDGFLAETGIHKDEYDLYDGSGLSRMNLVAPAAVVQLLRALYRSPHRETWLDLLPAAGEDGTLTNRFRGTAAEARIRAKTGSLTHVHALAGYARTRRGHTRAFAVLANNAHVPASAVRAAIDRIGILITE